MIVYMTATFYMIVFMLNIIIKYKICVCIIMNISFHSYIDNKAIIEIIDNGTGFSENLIDKAIEPYFTTTKGMGLGLAIVKKIVDEHYGNIKLANNKTRGAKISIIFKLDQLNNVIKEEKH